MARDYIHLQVRFYNDELFNNVKRIAKYENRSMNAQILEFLKLGVANYKWPPTPSTPSIVDSNDNNEQ